MGTEGDHEPPFSPVREMLLSQWVSIEQLCLGTARPASCWKKGRSGALGELSISKLRFGGLGAN